MSAGGMPFVSHRMAEDERLLTSRIKDLRSKFSYFHYFKMGSTLLVRKSP